MPRPLDRHRSRDVPAYSLPLAKMSVPAILTFPAIERSSTTFQYFNVRAEAEGLCSQVDCDRHATHPWRGPAARLSADAIAYFRFRLYSVQPVVSSAIPEMV